MGVAAGAALAGGAAARSSSVAATTEVRHRRALPATLSLACPTLASTEPPCEEAWGGRAARGGHKPHRQVGPWDLARACACLRRGLAWLVKSPRVDPSHIRQPAGWPLGRSSGGRAGRVHSGASAGPHQLRGCPGADRLAALATHGTCDAARCEDAPRVVAYPCAGGDTSQDPRGSHWGRS